MITRPPPLSAHYALPYNCSEIEAGAEIETETEAEAGRMPACA